MSCSTKCWNAGLTLSCFIGLGLSIYAYFVEHAASQDENYKAMCDISEQMSCTSVFKSEYAKGFGIVGPLLGKDSVFYKPNSLLGMIFYSLMIVLGQSNKAFVTQASIFAIILSNLSSIYFASILYFILHDFCVVCISTYVVNFINLICILKKYKSITSAQKTKVKAN